MPKWFFYQRHGYVPDKSPATKVEKMGVFLSLTRARHEKSRPSRAIAKIMRGSGNMEPRRLSQEPKTRRRKRRKAEIFNVKEKSITWFHTRPNCNPTAS